MKNTQFGYQCVLIILLVIQNYCTCLGQDYNKITPASPQAYSFAQYADIPVGYHTGVPEISIPIYTIKDGSVSLPISLSYHASGIKVEQEATWVGLGWTLNAGGMITRSKLGTPDKIGGKGADPLTNRDQYSDNNAYWYYDAIYSKSKDSEHDIFYYNFPGASGKFALDDLGNPVLLETVNIKIIPLGVTDFEPFGWELIDETGTKYIFGDVSKENNYLEKFASNYPIDYYTSGWCLKEIQYVNGQKISFYYADEEVRSSKSMVKVMQEYHVYTNDGTVNDKYRNEDVAFSTKRLAKIESDNATIFFDAEKLRADLSSSNSYALTKIRILDKNNLPLKSYSFSSSYFQNSEADDYNTKRLRLDGIKELTSEGLSTGQNWSFFYNSLMLPAKGSCAQDLFGYFNGQTGNTSLVPKISETVSATEYNPNWYHPCGYEGLESKMVSVGEAERSTNPAYIGACLIDSIRYPTGGSTKFIFEPNSYNFIGSKEIESTAIGGGVRIKEIRNYYNDNSFINTIYTYKMLDTDGVTETTKSSGVLNNKPKFYSFRSNNVTSSSCSLGDWMAPILVVSASPAYRLALTHGSPVGYRQVKVQKLSGTINNGCDVFEYTSGFDYPDVFRYSAPGYATYYNNSYSYGFGMSKWDSYFCNMSVMYGDISYEAYRGLLNKKSTYNRSNTLINKTVYSYSSNSIFLYYNYVAIQKALGDPTIEGGACHVPEFGYSFVVAPVNNCTNQLTGVYNYDYFDGKTVYTSKEYAYSHNQIIKETSIDSEGNNTIKKYKYPSDYLWPSSTSMDTQSSILFSMTDRNMINNPIEVTQLRDGNVTNSVLTTYKSINNLLVPDVKYGLEIANPISEPLWGLSFTAFSSENRVTFSKSNLYKPRLVYDLYDTKGNLLQYHEVDNVNNSFIWGYSQTLPVAEVKNASTSTVAIGNECSYIGFETNSNTSNLPDNDYWFLNADNGFSNDARTGHYSRKVQGQYSFSRTFIPNNQKQIYKFSAWVKTQTGFTLNKGHLVVGIKDQNDNYLPLNSYYQINFGDTNGEWKYFEVVVDLEKIRSSNNLGDATTLKINCYPWNEDYTTHYFVVDDVRFQPYNSLMSTYTYDPLVVMTSATNEKNITTFYQYDALGRLSVVKDQDGNIVKTYDYHYKE